MNITTPKTPPSIGPLTRRLVRWAAGKDDADLETAERRSAYGLVEGYVSVVLNLALFAVKLVLGLLTGSIALIADAVHTAADSLTSVVVIFASYISRQPPDKRHPFGHGRSEAVASVIIAVLLGVAGVEFAKESVLRILNPAPTSASWPIIGVVLITAGIKEWMSRFALRLAQRSGNRALAADAWHHRSDVFATLLVVAGMVGARYGLTWIDGAMGAGVSLLILKVAYDVAREAMDQLLGEAPDPDEVEAVKREAMAVDGVRGVHDVVIHNYGSRKFITLHIETSETLPAMELHQISHAVEKRLENRVAHSGHGSVNVHVDPLSTDHPAYDPVDDALIALVEADADAESFHDLRLVGDDAAFSVLFEIRVRSECKDPEAVAKRITAGLQEQFPRADILCEVDPEFSY